MLEAAAVGVFTKSVDFLFDECKKVLDERRERRRAQLGEKKEAPAPPAQTGASAPESSTPAPAAITTKEEALRQPVNPSTWMESQAQLEHLNHLMGIHLKNYRLYQVQYATFTPLYAPPHIVSALEHEEKQVLEVGREIERLLSGIFKTKVALLPDTDD